MSKGMTLDLYQDEMTMWSEFIVDGVVHRFCRDKKDITEEIGIYNLCAYINPNQDENS